MKTLKFLTYTVFVLFLSMSITSCKGDDGTEGPAGADGQDGNANVQTIRFQSPQWNTSTQTLFKQMTLQVPEITNEDINYSVILHYISFQNQHYTLLPVDNHFINGVGPGFSISASPSNLSSTIRISKTTNVALPNPTPSVDFVKIIIIKPSDITTITGNGRVSNPQQQAIYDELATANVDINNYYAVCAYYGINPE